MDGLQNRHHVNFKGKVMKDSNNLNSQFSEKENMTKSSESGFSFFNPPISNTKPYCDINLFEVHKMISGDIFSKVTHELRCKQNKDDAKAFKAKNFHFITFSGTFRVRNRAGLISHSGYICIDLDHIGQGDKLIEIKKSLCKDKYVALAFISPSGDGLKVVFKMPDDVSLHDQVFSALSNYLQRSYSLEVDQSGKDYTRACFIPHDSDAFFNDESTLTDHKFISEYADFHPSVTTKIDDLKSNSQNHRKPEDAIIEKCIDELSKKETFSEGNRNRFITRLTYILKDKNVSEKSAKERLVQFAETGFSQNEILATINSIYYAHNHNNLILSIDGFPYRLRMLIEECADVYGTNRDFFSTAFLHSTCVAIGKTFTLETQYSNPPLLWTALVAKSGQGKSQPIKIALDPIDFFEAENHFPYYQNNNIQPPKYGSFQYTCVDSTPEALMELLLNNERGVGLIRDELAGLIKDFGRYNKSGEVENLISSWDNGNYKINRKGQSGLVVKKPFIPIIGTIQPDILPILAKEGRLHNGFLSRFNYTFPEVNLKSYFSDKVLRTESLQYYKDYIKSLLDLDKISRIQLSKDAHYIYEVYYNELVDKINTETSDLFCQIYSKQQVIVLRIALILHIANNVGSSALCDPIKAEIMEIACNMSKYYTQAAQKVFSIITSYTWEVKSGDLNDKMVAKYLLEEKEYNKTQIANVLKTSRSQVERLIGTKKSQLNT